MNEEKSKTITIAKGTWDEIRGMIESAYKQADSIITSDEFERVPTEVYELADSLERALEVMDEEY